MSPGAVRSPLRPLSDATADVATCEVPLYEKFLSAEVVKSIIIPVVLADQVGQVGLEARRQIMSLCHLQDRCHLSSRDHLSLPVQINAILTSVVNVSDELEQFSGQM